MLHYYGKDLESDNILGRCSICMELILEEDDYKEIYPGKYCHKSCLDKQAMVDMGSALKKKGI